MPNNQPVKIAVLGGSAVATPELIDALRLQAHQPGSIAIQLMLYARTASRLEVVAQVAAQMARECEWLSVSHTTDLAQALDGAQFVLNQVRIGGQAARAFDETFPIPFGIPGEETVGPGGFANALRTVPEVVKLAHEIERHAPEALLLSFTNPASVIQYAVARATKLNVIGLCDGPVMMTAQAAAAIGAEPSELSVDYLGMHHFGFITRVIRYGHDETANMLAGLERVPGLDLDLDLVRSMGVLPTPYFRYFVKPDEILAKQKQQKQSRAQQLMALEAELLAEFRSAEGRPAGLSRRGAKWYERIVAPVLMALVEGRSAPFIINVVNHETLPWLPGDAIIETPCLLDARQIRPMAIQSAPGELRARIQLNCAYEQLMVEAILEQSEAKALRALTLNPMVPSVGKARELLKLIWPEGRPAQERST
jgi:6-phospho-beta-glucosidase